MKNKMRAVFSTVIFILIVVCTLRIKYVNEHYSQIDTIYTLEDSIMIDGIRVASAEWCLMYQDELIEKYDCDDGAFFDRYVVLELDLKNETEGDLNISEMLAVYGGAGFETYNWCSVLEEFKMRRINKYNGDIVRSGHTIKYVACVGFNRFAFDSYDWHNIDNEEFYYVLNLGEKPRKINLGTYSKRNKG